jgi:hypothetical protein
MLRSIFQFKAVDLLILAGPFSWFLVYKYNAHGAGVKAYGKNPKKSIVHKKRVRL